MSCSRFRQSCIEFNPAQKADGAAYGKVGHVSQEGIDLDHLLDGRAGLLEHGLEIANAGGRLLLNGALDQVSLRIARDLARAVDGVRGLDGLGLCDRSDLDSGHGLRHRAQSQQHT